MNYRTRPFKCLPEDIRGSDVSAGNCPTARCVRRTLKKEAAVPIFVWHGHIQVGERVYHAPSIVDEKEVNNTRGIPIQAFTFDMNNQPIQS